MSKNEISILVTFSVLGYTLYRYKTIADKFDNLVSHAVEKALDVNDSQTNFSRTVPKSIT
jgi:meiotically up-regulated gene 157 (Mug157) protein